MLVTPSPLERRIQSRWDALSPAEQRVARRLLQLPGEALIGSAAQIATASGTSDATVIRAVQALGYGGLSELRREVLAGLQAGATPAARLRRSLDAVGGDLGVAFDTALSIQQEAVDALRDPDVRASAQRSVALMLAAERIAVFGIGPSRALADYFVIQLRRLGRAVMSLTATGMFLADELLPLQARDLVVMFAYSRRYREVEATLRRANQVSAPVVLISDSLGPALRERVAEVLPARRGRAGQLAMHGATFVLMEMLLLGVAAAAPDPALATLARLNSLRAGLSDDPADTIDRP